ncbi:hypothetical protein [Streptomyces sp. NPDC006784]|uniref:hypothetical protein n=1 Tax=Streptomyces sp. NPDC006784 TaxID=3364764 RepID=UPI00369B0EB6
MSTKIPPRPDKLRKSRPTCDNPFALTDVELRAEIIRCLDRGWQAWELRRRFTRRQP